MQQKSTRIGILIFLLLNVYSVFGQESYKVSGVVKNSDTGEPIFGAVISARGTSSKTISTDFDGKFDLQLFKGTYEITCEGFGLTPQKKVIEVNENITLTFAMKEEVIMVDAITFESLDEVEQKVESTDMGKVELQMEEIKKIPALMGEVDVMKTLQLLPGVQSAGEGVSGLYVRGGSVDQNLVLLDDAPVYNPSHLFGFFSIFNAASIDNVTLYKGMIPAEFGGRLSSVVDFKTKDPNLDSLTAEGGIGLISSRLTLQAPIVKGKTGFMFAGRRTYIDVISKPFFKGEDGSSGVPYYFQDYNLKLFHKFSETDELSYSGYYGDDGLSFNFLDGRVEADIDWGNITSSLTWNHKFNENIDLELVGFYSFYRFKAETRFDNLVTNANSKVRDYGLKGVINQYVSEKHSLHYGLEYSFHKYTPRDIESGSTEGNQFAPGTLNQHKYAHESAIFIGDDYKISKKFRAEIALRGSMFTQVGPYSSINESTRDTNKFKGGEKVTTYTAFEPRLGLRYKLNDNSSVKASLVRTNQYVHLVSLSGSNLPFDVWVPSSDVLKPQNGMQYSAGYFKNFKENTYSSSVEVYYRTMNNVKDFDQYFTPTLNGEVEYSLIEGKGWAYGAEFLLRKEKGKLTGWIGYTLSWTTLQFDGINDGEKYPSRYDRRHDLSIVASYELNPKWTISSTFVYGTGQAITIQEGRYFIGESVVNIYGPRNGYRMPSYHRLDLAINWRPNRNNKRFKSDWTLAIYNIYSRANPFFIYVNGEADPDTQELNVTANMIYLFPILPTINWNFTF